VQYDAWKTQEKEDLKEYVVAVLDDGIDETNPDLAGVLWNGEVFDKGGDSHGFYSGNLIPGMSPGTSTTGLTGLHGTHVAGIIASDWNGQGT
ncbi:MAG: S8 family serine peptidase, partial [Erysipelotrichaceae bacterium]|nr:S8 family serine peptidase [Erysipelotrichaceae bacterium]